MKSAVLEILVYRDLARLAAAALRVPTFLVLSESPDKGPKWLDSDLVPVAERWLANACGEALLPEAVEMVSQIGIAMNAIVETFLALHPATAASQQPQHLAWKIQRQAVLTWLGQAGTRELNRATQAWQRRTIAPEQAADGAAAAWQAWDQIHTLPELSTLRAALVHEMESPPPAELDAPARYCGMRPLVRRPS